MQHIFNKQKILLLLLVLILLVTFFHVGNEWKYCIEGGVCARGMINDWLRPIYYASLSLLGFFSFFLLLPIRYFYWWLLIIFSWGLPVSILLVQERFGSLAGPFPIYTREIIIILSILFGFLTLLFVGVMYWLERRRHTQ